MISVELSPPPFLAEKYSLKLDFLCNPSETEMTSVVIYSFPVHIKMI